MNVLVTGSSGLIGSEAVVFFDALGFRVTGVDNNMRADFFGPAGDTTRNRLRLRETCTRFTHRDQDVRDRAAMDALFAAGRCDLVIHAAAQPSHDLAARRPFDDFEVNAVGTLNLLEACRRHSPRAVFIFMSTNKVDGDRPNHIPLVEHETRCDYADPRYAHGIPEEFPVDRCLHSLFGSSKLAVDVLTEEYARYFGLVAGIFRGSCLTGPRHAGVELHGFLSWLVRSALEERPYTVHGYKGKQVRDQIHAHDVVSAPSRRIPGPVRSTTWVVGGTTRPASSSASPGWSR